MTDTAAQTAPTSAPTVAWGYGLATYAGTQGEGGVLDTWYPSPRLGSPDQELEAPPELARLEGVDEVRGVRRLLVRTVVEDLQAPPADTADVWLRLHLLSHRLVAPHSVNLDGIFGKLTNVVWTDQGPCAVENFESTRLRMTEAHGRVTVLGVDKFPRMTDYVLPTGVRIGRASCRERV